MLLPSSRPGGGSLRRTASSLAVRPNDHLDAAVLLLTEGLECLEAAFMSYPMCDQEGEPRSIGDDAWLPRSRSCSERPLRRLYRARLRRARSSVMLVDTGFWRWNRGVLPEFCFPTETEDGSGTV